MIINNYKVKKVVDYLKEKRNGRVLLLMRHGLGDIINFIPIVEELNKRYPFISFFIGVEEDRKSSLIYSKIFEYNRNSILNLRRQFTYFFLIHYSEPYDDLSKPYLCNRDEIGLESFNWTPYKMKIEKLIIKNRIGVHFFGSTNQNNKSLTTEEANIFWDDLVTIGKSPFEIHNPKYNLYLDLGHDFYKFPNTIRFNNPNIKEIIDEISKCEYFIGIDSGMLYLAITILGVEKCIGIEKNYKISKYFPYGLKTINLSEFGSINLNNFEKLRDLFKEK
jgi:hypothetical protein